MTLLGRIWRGFVHLFGLDACPVPAAQVGSPTPRQRAARARLERLVRSD